MGERVCQWLHRASVQEHDTALKPIHLISDLTDYDMKQQIKWTSDMEGKKTHQHSWKI